MTRPRVIIGLPEAGLNGVSVFAAHLSQGLNAHSWPASLLITHSTLTPDSPAGPKFELPTDTPWEGLPVHPDDDWATRWEALIRYLEERAPCIYLPNHDWRMSVVSKRLSDRVRIVGVLHTDLAVDYDHIKRLGRYWNAIVGVTEAIRLNAIVSMPHLARRIVAIPYGVPVAEKLPPRAGMPPLRLVYHGALRYEQKRVFDLLEIANILRRRGVAFELTIIGDGPACVELEQKAQSLIEHNLVHRLQSRPNSELLPLLAQQDVFLLTSEFEGLPLALLEAMGQGCIPVISDLPTLAQIVREGENGYRLPVGDCVAFADRLTELAQHPERRQVMAAAAHQTVTTGGYRIENMIQAYLELFEQVEADSQQGIYWRARGPMEAPPAKVGVAHILPGRHMSEVDKVNAVPLWPNTIQRPIPARPNRISRASRNLEDYQVIFGTIMGAISGVDVFAINLARSLTARGLPAKIVLTLPTVYLPAPHEMPAGIVTERLQVGEYAPWPQRWQAMSRYLEAHAPCFYIPNYDWLHSCISPKLPDGVKVIGIAHSDDPQHYEHVARLGRYWDAVVGVSSAISRHIAALDPSLVARLHTIPYGIPVSTSPSLRQPRADGALRIIYTGRVMQAQKRSLDVIRIAQILSERGVNFELIVAGNGDEYEAVSQAGRDLIARLQVRLLGKVSNEQVNWLLANSDVFLLTSAFEGLPVSLLEAMGQGCVPVVSDLRSGIPDIIRNGENGFTVPVADIAGFANRLEVLACNPTLRQQMGQAAHRTIVEQGFRLDEMSDRYVQLFEEVLVQDYLRPAGNIRPRPGLKIRYSWLTWLPSPLRRVMWAMRRIVKGRD